MAQMVLTLYSRPKCHLCEQAKLEILELKKDYPFLLKEVNIDQSDELTEKYGLKIPVLLFNGKEVAFGQINKFTIINFFQEVF